MHASVTSTEATSVCRTDTDTAALEKFAHACKSGHANETFIRPNVILARSTDLELPENMSATDNQPADAQQTITQYEAVENVLARFTANEIIIPGSQRDADQWVSKAAVSQPKGR